ncbi:hypothetical protein ABR738_01460 [Streptomyces sp. Edi4]|uniref:hypothetical protein n=1 Tax=Streptomyces sp. Edi4 TaxID=3162527 RepID=UPI003305AE0D
MPDDSPCRHADWTASPEVSESAPAPDTSRHAFTPVRQASEQEVTTTASRQLRHANDFRAAAQFMVASGHLPGAGRTTLRLAEAFASRMERSKDGHFVFNIEATCRELGLRRRAVLNHSRILRELGLTAYVEHGTRTNSQRTRHGAAWTQEHGYRGTATIFAAVAPPAWDHAMGRRIDGSGYQARPIGVTEKGRARAIAAACRKTASPAPRRTSSCTPSVVVPQDHSQLKVEGGSKYTSRTRATGRNNAHRPSSPTRHRSSPADCARGIAIAEQLQLEVWWLHRGCTRRLAYVLRPLIASGWTWQALTAELRTWGVPGYLRDPAAYVRHQLARLQHYGHLAHTGTPALGDDQIDEDGSRHQAMLRGRQQRSHPAWQHYAEHVRSELRRRLQEARSEPPQTPVPEYRPWLREPEHLHLRSLSLEAAYGPEASPRQIYAARASNRPLAARQEAATVCWPDQGWLEQMREEMEAKRACAVLQAELDNWQATQAFTSRTT